MVGKDSQATQIYEGCLICQSQSLVLTECEAGVRVFHTTNPLVAEIHHFGTHDHPMGLAHTKLMSQEEDEFAASVKLNPGRTPLEIRTGKNVGDKENIIRPATAIAPQLSNLDRITSETRKVTNKGEQDGRPASKGAMTAPLFQHLQTMCPESTSNGYTRMEER